MPGFISFSYWFSLYPPVLTFVPQVILGALFAILIAVGLIVLLVIRRNASSKSRKHALGTLGHIALWAGISGIFWLLCTVFGVPVLGMRVWLLVGGVFFAWICRGPLRELRTSIPLQEQSALNKASYEKWLPKPKK